MNHLTRNLCNRVRPMASLVSERFNGLRIGFAHPALNRVGSPIPAGLDPVAAGVRINPVNAGLLPLRLFVRVLGSVNALGLGSRGGPVSEQFPN